LRNVACFCIPAPPPHDCQYATEQYILGENAEKCCSKRLRSTLPSEAAAFKLLAIISSSDHLHPLSVSPQKDPAFIDCDKYMQTTFAYISHDNCATFYFLLPSTLQQSSSQTFSQDPSSSCFEFDLWTAYFVDPPRAFFSLGDYSTALSDYSTALSDDFDTV